MADERNADASFLGGAGSGRKDDALWLEIFDLFYGQLVVAADDHLGAELTHVLHQVVGEGIVVVENEDHERHFLQCRAGSGNADVSHRLSGEFSRIEPELSWNSGRQIFADRFAKKDFRLAR